MADYIGFAAYTVVAAAATYAFYRWALSGVEKEIGYASKQK